MKSRATSFKIGLFTFLVLGAVIVVTLALGLRASFREKVHFYTYLDQSIAGLDVGAAVNYRGISIGKVDSVGVAAAGRWVEVRLAVEPARASLLEWSPADDNGLRARVALSGISGMKIVDVDLLDPESHPPPQLPFPPPRRYVPGAPSALTELADTVSVVSDKLLATLQRVDDVADSFLESDAAPHLVETLAEVRGAASDLRGALRQIGDRKLPARAASAIDTLEGALESVRRMSERAGADGGLVETAERAAGRVDLLGARAAGLTNDLDRMLRDLSDAARAVRSFAAALERDPDMLLKGRAKGRAGSGAR